MENKILTVLDINVALNNSTPCWSPFFLMEMSPYRRCSFLGCVLLQGCLLCGRFSLREEAPYGGQAYGLLNC